MCKSKEDGENKKKEERSRFCLRISMSFKSGWSMSSTRTLEQLISLKVV